MELLISKYVSSIYCIPYALLRANTDKCREKDIFVEHPLQIL